MMTRKDNRSPCEPPSIETRGAASPEASRARVQFSVEVAVGRLVLSGDLMDSPDVQNAVHQALRNAALSNHELVIEAEQARIIPGGVELWNAAVTRYLSNLRLVYLPSHLAMLLRFDDAYTHTRSDFPEC